MKKVLSFVALLACYGALETQADLIPPTLDWGPILVGTGSASVYYLNDNVFGGNVLGARISSGPYEQDKAGTVVNALMTTNTTMTAKSATRVGDYVYFTGDNGGVYRTQVANTATPWSTFASCTVSNAKALETITTDGIWIYGSTSTANDQIHAYSVDALTGALTLVWSTTGIAGRVRGLDWDASGYLYAADGGGPAENIANNTSHLYAIDAATGTTMDMGIITFNGRQYQTLREGDQIVVFDSFTGSGVPPGQMYVYDLASDTNLTSTIPVATWNPDGIGRIFGAAIDGDNMWLTSGGGQTYGYTIPEPGTAAILFAGVLGLALVRRTHRRRV